MIQDSQQSEELQKLTLPEILQRQDLVMQEILAIKDIHIKIKRSIKTFIDYCRVQHSFTERLIMLGLKCPMHQSNNQNMKYMTYIASDILTSDHESLADLFILPQHQTSQHKTHSEIVEEIEEEIESDTVLAKSEEECDKYKFLRLILDYLNSLELDENCLNYITKALQIVIRRKINHFFQFFSANPNILKRMIDISHFPSIAHFLAKMLTDDEDKLTTSALQVKQKLIPLILQKIHLDIGKPQTAQILDCIEDVLNSTRYGDTQQRSPLQKMADLSVSQKELSFHLNTLISSLSAEQIEERHLYQVINSASYLSIVVNRMNMDEQQDYNFTENQEFKPTQLYQVDSLYAHFCKLIFCFRKFWAFKPKFQKTFWYASNKLIQPLMLLMKHSRFGSFYAKIDRQERQSALKALIYITCQYDLHGILLQSVTTLLEKMLIEEEVMAQTSNQTVFPGDLYSVISQHVNSIGSSVKILLEENTNQRNRNQNGIYFRKILLLLDNYFKHSSILKRYPKTSSLQTMFPSFNTQNCKLFAQKAAILNHPDGKRVKKVSQFEFIAKNINLIRSSSPELESQSIASKEQVFQKKALLQTPVQIVFKLEGKLKALKQRAKQKSNDKVQVTQTNSQKTETLSLDVLGPVEIKTMNPSIRQEQAKQQVGVKANEKLNFFVKHLMIY